MTGYTAQPGDYHADAQTLHARRVRDDLLSELKGMTADLQGHIERRAAELAQPLIDQAREDAAVEVKSAQGMQQRAEDLNTELRRQLRPLGRQVDHYRQRAETAEAANARVRQLHAETPHKPGTCYCANPYPCPTIRALDGEEQHHA